MLVAVLNTCTKEELEESDEEEVPVSPTADEGDARKKVIKNKIMAVGRMARVFALLRSVRPLPLSNFPTHLGFIVRSRRRCPSSKTSPARASSRTARLQPVPRVSKRPSLALKRRKFCNCSACSSSDPRAAGSPISRTNACRPICTTPTPRRARRSSLDRSHRRQRKTARTIRRSPSPPTPSSRRSPMERPHPRALRRAHRRRRERQRRAPRSSVATGAKQAWGRP